MSGAQHPEVVWQWHNDVIGGFYLWLFGGVVGWAGPCTAKCGIELLSMGAWAMHLSSPPHPSHTHTPLATDLSQQNAPPNAFCCEMVVRTNTTNTITAYKKSDKLVRAQSYASLIKLVEVIPR